MPITGEPFAQLGEGGVCPPPIGVVPAVCSDCRQVDRWIGRSVGWSTKTVSRFKNILLAILKGHDETLQSLCGLCFAQSGTQTCACLFAEYQSYGLPSVFEALSESVACQYTYTPLKLYECAEKCLAGCIQCLTIVNEPVSEIMVLTKPPCALTCSNLVFDPCGDPAHLTILMRVLAAVRAKFNKPATGATILEVVGLLFPGNTPAIVATGNGSIYVNIGRPFTAAELPLIEFYRSLIPAGFGVNIEFAIP